MGTATGQPRGSAAARVARNGVLSASTEILSKLCALVFFALVARTYGEASLGHYVFALAVTSLVWSFASFGLDRMALRDIARDPAAMRRLVVPIATLKGTASASAVLVVAGVLALAGADRESVLLVLIVGTTVTLGLVSSTTQAVFTAHERMEYVFLIKVPWALASALAGSAVILAGGGILLAASAGAVVSAMGLVFCFGLLVHYYGRPDTTLRARAWPGLLRTTAPFGLQEMLGQVVFRFDTVVLALLATSAVVGNYGAAFRMLEATLFLVWSLGYAVMPMYSYIDARAGDELRALVEGSLKLIVAIMVPIATAYVICARPIIDLVFGLPEYEDSVGLLRLLAPAIVAYGFGHLVGLLVLVRRPGRLTVYATGAVAAFNVVACFVLIPWLGAEGAAIATLASELLLAALGLWMARAVIGMPRMAWIAGAPLGAAIAMAGVMSLLDERLWLALPAGALTYAAVLFALEARRLREDLGLLRSITGRRPPEGSAA